MDIPDWLKESTTDKKDDDDFWTLDNADDSNKKS
jgi:hypothetical protein